MYNTFYNNYSINDPRFGEYNFYIHRHMSNIGKMAIYPSGKVQNAVSGDEIEQKYHNLYDIKNVNNESVVSTAVKEQYISLLKNKIKNNDSISYFKKIEEEGVGPYSDSLIKAMNEHIEAYLRSNLTAEYIANIIKNSNSINWNYSISKEDLKKPLQELSHKQIFSQLDHVIDKVLQGISILEQTKTADKELFDTLSQIIKQVTKQNYSSVNALGGNLLSSLQDFKTGITANKKINKTISAKAVFNLVDELVIVARQLKYGKSGIVVGSSGEADLSNSKDLTFQALKDTFDKGVLPIGFGETAAGLALIATNEAIKEEMMLTVRDNHIHYTGKDTGYLEIFDSQGNNIIKKYMGETAQSIKTDLEYQNFGMHFFITDINQSIYELKFDMDLGLSLKTYRGLSTYNDNNWGNQKISVGGGMNLGAAIVSLPIDNYLKYLGFNAISYRRYKDMKSAYEQIKQVAFLRSMVYLFSSRNTQDFSQFIFINGMLVSIWDIINYVFANLDLVMTNSQSGVNFKIKENIKSISKDLSKKRTHIDEEFNEEAMIARVKSINQGINSMKMTGSIAPLRVLQWAGKM